MKSIIEEASSITQAIETAWERAGKPQEFTVKVFEEPEKSFFGMRTVKSAKIGLFFKEDAFLLGIPKKAITEKKARPSHEKRKPRSAKKTDRQERLKKRDDRPVYDKGSSDKKEPKEKQKDLFEKPKKEKLLWTNEMVHEAQQWIKKSLNLLDLPNINFTTNVSRNHLRVQFDNSITGDEKKERMLYSSFANLIMASMRNKFKKEFRNLRVVISH